MKWNLNYKLLKQISQTSDSKNQSVSQSVSKNVKLCVRVLTVKLHSLPQSNKGEDGNVVSHADEEDEPQGEGEVFHVSQLDHLT